MYFSMPAMPWLSMLTVPRTCAAVGSARIEAAVLDAEADAGHAELVHRLLLARRDLPLDVGERGVGGEELAEPPAVELGEHRGEQLRRLVGVHDVARLGEERGGPDVGGERLAVAVDDVGARLRGRLDETRRRPPPPAR